MSNTDWFVSTSELDNACTAGAAACAARHRLRAELHAMCGWHGEARCRTNSHSHPLFGLFALWFALLAHATINVHIAGVLRWLQVLSLWSVVCCQLCAALFSRQLLFVLQTRPASTCAAPATVSCLVASIGDHPLKMSCICAESVFCFLPRRELLRRRVLHHADYVLLQTDGDCS
jgi:hypothetical protein